ncbi:MAG TPA: tetratricopeptide repeat protein, partial [Parachlamydiaceae bacterium]|nr:tetratricopeptide repeat protein [Parachlamydiaceae bacterium]
MKNIPDIFKIQFCIFLGVLALVFAMWALRSGDERVGQAEESYRKGEAASTISERKTAFNTALDLFMKLDADYQPNLGTGKLDFNLANTYYQLGEYPSAILHYQRAEQLMPRSEAVKRNLMQAQKKSELNVEENRRLFDVLLGKTFLSLPERLQLFFVLAVLTLIFISGWFWTRNPWLSKAAVFCLIPASIALLNLVATYYFSPVDAILIRSEELRRDAGREFATVGDKPIPGGSSLEVINTVPNGRWLKVLA